MWLCLLVAARQRECPGKVLRRRRPCVQWTAMRGILRSTDRPPRSQPELSSLQTVDFFRQQPTVGSIRGLLVRSPYIGRRRSSSWSFVLRPRWLVLPGVGSSNVYIRHVNSTGEFCSPFLVRHRSDPMLHGVVLNRCSELSSIAGIPHAPSFTAPLWSASGHSLGNVLDVVPMRPSSVERPSVSRTVTVSASTVERFLTPAITFYIPSIYRR